MRKLLLEQNPFFVLEVTPCEKRNAIIAKAEEKVFFSKENEIEEAQASLISTAKRTTAELEWFFGISEDRQAEIIDCIKEKKEIYADDLSGFSRLNATLYNVEIHSFGDDFELGYAVVEIDELFGRLSTSEILSTINSCRAQSGIVAASESDVIAALKKRRETIRQTLSEQLECLGEQDYIKLVTKLAEQCGAEERLNDGVIIGDIVDQYEIRMKTAVDEKMNAAISIIDSTRQSADVQSVNQQVKKLIAMLRAFDEIAQPLQIKYASEGSDHEQSLHLAQKCRSFAIKLHNDFHNSEASILLVHALQEIFPELVEFSEVITKDESQITKIKEENDKFKRDAEANRQANKQYIVGIRGNRFAIPPYCTCCMKSTTGKELISCSQTTQYENMNSTTTVSASLPICPECLRHRSQYTSLLVLLCALSLVAGCVVTAVLMAVRLDAFFSFVFGAGTVIGFYYLLTNVIKTKPLAEEHARRGKSVELLSGGFGRGTGHNYADAIFTFYNWEYAQLFREANKENASEIKESYAFNTAQSTSVQSINEHPVACLLNILGIFAVVAFFIIKIFVS